MGSRLKDFEVPQSILDTPGAFPSDPSGLQTVGTSAPQSLSAAVRARKDEFTRKKTIKVKVGSWNVAALSGTEKDLGPWFVKGLGIKGLSEGMGELQSESKTDLPHEQDVESVEDQEARRQKKKISVPQNDHPAVPHGDDIDLYVLGLQEVIDIASVTEAMKPYTDPNPGKRWKSAMRSHLPDGYEKVAEQQLLGLLVLVFASPEIAPAISNVSCTSVGTGLMGYLGNKGAVSVRIVLGESTRMCFVNCHLAAGADNAALQRRIWDTNQILQRTRFAPVSIDGEQEGPEEKIGDEDFGFWFGDLNYRLDDIPGEDVRRLLLLHTRNEYDVLNKSKIKIDSELGYLSTDDEDDTKPSDSSESVTRYEFPDVERPASHGQADPPLDPKSDPASLVTTINSLLAHDQLHGQQRQKKVFHEGWREGEIHFLPTYKYDVGSVGMFDSGEKKRSPSWCDRILYRTRTDRMMYEDRAAKEARAQKRDDEMKKSGLDEAAAEQDVLFDYHPETDGLAYGDDYDEEQDSLNDAELVETHDGHEDDIQLEHYLSHQRVLSSDHKPIDAVFTVTYDAVVPELKAKIHAEVARELDKAENEARPTITVVTENHTDTLSDAGGEASTDNITPTTSSDVNSINFGRLPYDVSKHRSITIANTGQLSAKFSFVGRGTDAIASAEDSAIAPSWLTVSSLDPSSPEHAEYAAPSKDYTLSPGDTRTLYLTAHIGASNTQLIEQLNDGAATLEDVLILRVAGGRDHFLPLRALWLPTCFHRSLDELVVAPSTGVRDIPRKRNNRDATGTAGVKSSPGSGAGRNSAPRELFALTEAVQLGTDRALVEWEMIHPDEAAPWTTESGEKGWPFSSASWTLPPGEEREDLKAQVREALDTARPIHEHLNPETEAIIRLEVVAETLTEFLASVRGGIVTEEMYTSIITQLGDLEKEKHSTGPTNEEILSIVMDALGGRPVHSVSLTFLTFMLGRLLGEVALLPTSTTTNNNRGSQSVESAQQHIQETAPTGDEQQHTRARASSQRSFNSSDPTNTEAPHPHTTDADNTSTTSTSGGARAKASAFLNSLSRRSRRSTSVSSGSGTHPQPQPPSSTATTHATSSANANDTAAHKQALKKREAYLTAYARIFAPLIVRAEGRETWKGRERKVKEEKVVGVVRGVLEGSVFTS